MKTEPEIKWAAEEKRARDWGLVFDKLLGDAVPARSGGLRPEPKVSALRAPPAIAKGASE